MIRKAPAKLNLDLRVAPPTQDGFHPIHSWFCAIDFHDQLSAEPTDDDRHRFTCDRPDLPMDGKNLVVRAVAAFEQAAGQTVPPQHWHLEKVIPAGGGLGGGSSDAAAVLSICQKLLPADVDLSRVGLSLGSDVPFFVHHQATGITHATCTGRGEIVEPFEPTNRLTPLVLLTGISVATPDVFRMFDHLPPPPHLSPDYVAASSLDAAQLLSSIGNDLTPAAFAVAEALATTHAMAVRRLDQPVHLTGSGGTLFTLYDTPDAAAEAATHVQELAVAAVVAGPADAALRREESPSASSQRMTRDDDDPNGI